VDSRTHDLFERSAESCFASRQHRNFHGFSLVEFMICVAIIATIAAIAVPNYIEAVNTAKVVQAMGDIKYIQSEIDIYWVGYSQLPNSLDDIGLLEMKDPWGSPYQYLKIAGGGANKGSCRKDKFLNPLNDDYDLYSMGRDGSSTPPLTARQSRDDVVRAANGGFIGPAENY
jgi:general secretion pathway protein G